jgi:HTH-like domain
LAGNGRLYKEEAKIAQLERMVGRLTMENDFLKGVVQVGSGEEAQKMMANEIQQMAIRQSMSISRLCELARVPRRRFYRLRATPAIEDDNLDLRDQIQRVAVKWPSYGYRRITRKLARRGIAVNHKLVLKLMRTDNFLCLRRNDS